MDALQKDVMLCFLTVVLHEEENAKAEKSGQQAGAEVAMKDKLQKEYGKVAKYKWVPKADLVSYCLMLSFLI